MEPEVIPLYMNWSFWAVVVAAVAVILSQIPPIHTLLKSAKLDLEVYSKISISHKLGNPNLQLHIIINNIGGRKVRVKSLDITVSRAGNNLVKLPAQNYLQNQADKTTVLFTPFSISPNEEWAHITNFLEFFNREDENQYREIEARMLEDFRAKRPLAPQNDDAPIILEDAVVQPAKDFFNRHYLWRSGEYTLAVNVKTENDKANISKNYRFTIFESHEGQLRAISEHYNTGAGIWWDPKIPTNVLLDVQEA